MDRGGAAAQGLSPNFSSPLGLGFFSPLASPPHSRLVESWSRGRGSGSLRSIPPPTHPTQHPPRWLPRPGRSQCAPAARRGGPPAGRSGGERCAGLGRCWGPCCACGGPCCGGRCAASATASTGTPATPGTKGAWGGGPGGAPRRGAADPLAKNPPPPAPLSSPLQAPRPPRSPPPPA